MSQIRGFGHEKQGWHGIIGILSGPLVLPNYGIDTQ